MTKTEKKLKLFMKELNKDLSIYKNHDLNKVDYFLYQEKIDIIIKLKELKNYSFLISNELDFNFYEVLDNLILKVKGSTDSSDDCQNLHRVNQIIIHTCDACYDIINRADKLEINVILKELIKYVNDRETKQSYYSNEDYLKIVYLYNDLLKIIVSSKFEIKQLSEANKEFILHKEMFINENEYNTRVAINNEKIKSMQEYLEKYLQRFKVLQEIIVNRQNANLLNYLSEKVDLSKEIRDTIKLLNKVNK